MQARPCIDRSTSPVVELVYLHPRGSGRGAKRVTAPSSDPLPSIPIIQPLTKKMRRCAAIRSPKTGLGPRRGGMWRRPICRQGIPRCQVFFTPSQPSSFPLPPPLSLLASLPHEVTLHDKHPRGLLPSFHHYHPLVLFLSPPP